MLPTRSTTAIGLSAVALFATAGGPAVAADATSSAFRALTGKQVKDNSLTGKDIRNGTLTAQDFKAGELPAAGAGQGGAAGAQGERGPEGPAGPQGAPGKDGAAGVQGPAGPQGETGEKGEKGATGAQGPQGPQGPAGTAPATEAWHNVGAPGEPPFATDVGFPGYAWWNTWTHQRTPAGFYKDGTGRVYLRGHVKCDGNTCPSASLIFRLPEAYRPATTHIFATLAGADQYAAGSLARVNVSPDGWVSRAPGMGGHAWLALDGISFRP